MALIFVPRTVTDRYVSTIKQAVLSAERTLSDRFAIDGLVGFTRSDLDQPVRTTITLDAVNTNNFSWDYRGGRRIPLINYGVDITNPNAFAFGPGAADGTVTGILGVVENEVRNDFLTLNLNATVSFNDAFKAPLWWPVSRGRFHVGPGAASRRRFPESRLRFPPERVWRA